MRSSSSGIETRSALWFGPDLVEGVSGWGNSVHEALRDLADNLVREAVWIEVTDGKDGDDQR